MRESYQYLTDEQLQEVYSIYQRTLGQLETQKAGFGSLRVPVDIENQIQDALARLDEIRIEQDRRKLKAIKQENKSQNSSEIIYPTDEMKPLLDTVK